MPKPTKCLFCAVPVEYVNHGVPDKDGVVRVHDKVPTGTFCKGSIGKYKFNLYCCPNEECRGKLKTLLRGDDGGE